MLQLQSYYNGISADAHTIVSFGASEGSHRYENLMILIIKMINNGAVKQNSRLIWKKTRTYHATELKGSFLRNIIMDKV